MLAPIKSTRGRGILHFDIRPAVSIVALAAAIAMPAAAHAASAQSPDGPAQQPPAAAAPEQPQAGLAEIVVTAQRRTENLQRAAIPVSAVAGDVLTKQSVTRADDLTRLVPALQVAPAASFTQIYLRGIGTFGANAFAEQGVAFNLDGVYLSRPAAPAALFYDLERMEVLKGPQGTLYGRNATGGAVNLITVKPKLGEASGFVTGEYGNYNAIKASGAINLPLGSQAALRISAQHAQHDGYYSDGYDDEDTTAVRGQLRFDTGDGFNANLMVDYGDVGGKGLGGTIMPLLAGKDRLGPSDPRVLAEYLSRAPTAPVPQIIARGDGYQNNKYYGALVTVNADLGFAKLTVIPAWRRTDLDFVNYSSSFLIDVTEKSDQMSLEARLGNQNAQLKWVLGSYYFTESVKAKQFFDQGNNGTRINSNLGTDSYAVFGEATYSLTPRWRLTGGLRYTHDTKTQQTEAHTYPFVGFVPPAYPNFTPIVLDLTTNATTDVNFSKVTWKAGMEFDAGPHSLLYATVSTGFKSGILFSALGQNYSRPERLTAYTIGTKNRFFANTLQVNVEGFYWDYRDQQISHLAPVQVAATPAGAIYGPVFATENAGAAKLYGAEAEVLWQPTRNDLFSLNVQYLHATYDSLQYKAYSTTGPAPVVGCAITPTALMGASAAARIYNVDCSGKSLVNAPRWVVNAGYDHTFDMGSAGRIIAAVDTRVESSRYLSIDYLDLGRQGAYMMSNARLTWENAPGSLAITGFVNNLENALVFANSTQSPGKPGVIYNQMRPPRTYGVRGTLKF
ncbi:iron complex outermembrane receptor protein [Novosphingobium sp. GV055]|nr:iron complex outermembrane receptor protein [Novosphingobium sp. GV055]PUB04883.1 iron complex outermembrane receptor protein [Novosphingobium sp. GV061]PUB21202.1 iron complex outermembrane receptor protein [Novosphingobium sp. GV079]PUB42928.1 iron complex outermembrane receptor protein [Novosphingobium sp. GV027]